MSAENQSLPDPEIVALETLKGTSALMEFDKMASVAGPGEASDVSVDGLVGKLNALL